MFHIEDVVIKPSVGLCKIKAIRRMEIEDRTEDYYVIQSGDVDVLVPRKLADNGAIRHPMDEALLKRVWEQLEAPFRPAALIEDEEADTLRSMSAAEIKSLLRRRDPMELVEAVRFLHNKQQEYVLDKKESGCLTNASAMLVEEMAFVEKTTKGRIRTQLNRMLATGRKLGRRKPTAEEE